MINFQYAVNMKPKLLFLILLSIISSNLYSQDPAKTAMPFQVVYMTTAAVMQDLQLNKTASRYYETSQDLIFLDENLVGALNAITPGVVTPENLDYMKYINSRDQKPYREVWDHNVYMKYTVTFTDVRQLLTDPAAFADLKTRLGQEFNRLDPTVFINGEDRIMFILRLPNSLSGSFYRAILSNGSLRIDEISNWRDQ